MNTTVDETKATNLMKAKYGFNNNLARSIFKVTGGRLADIHKVSAICTRKYMDEIPAETVESVVQNVHKQAEAEQDVVKDITKQFEREMLEALFNALADKDSPEIKEYVIKEVLGTEEKTIEDITLPYRSNSSQQTVKNAIQQLLSHNVLRISKNRTLHPYNVMAKKVLKQWSERGR